jgi:hypothetical protein
VPAPLLAVAFVSLRWSALVGVYRQRDAGGLFEGRCIALLPYIYLKPGPSGQTALQELVYLLFEAIERVVVVTY